MVEALSRGTLHPTKGLCPREHATGYSGKTNSCNPPEYQTTLGIRTLGCCEIIFQRHLLHLANRHLYNSVFYVVCGPPTLDIWTQSESVTS